MKPLIVIPSLSGHPPSPDQAIEQYLRQIIMPNMIRKGSYDVFDADDPDRLAGSDSYGNVIYSPQELSMIKEAMNRSKFRK